MVDLAGSERVVKDGRNRNSLIILFQHLVMLYLPSHLKLATFLTGLSLTQSLL
jgi:hypothetical protein